jgi:hypothetical protein
MTPSLARVYDDLIAAAAAPALAPLVGPVRARFVELAGSFAPSDPWFEERSAAAWDRALVDPSVHHALRAHAPAAHHAALEALSAAQRGLFQVHPADDTVDVVCVVRGAAFRLARTDDAARAMSRGGAGGWIDAHVVPTVEGVALLPGLLVHSAEAIEPMRGLIHAPLPFEALLDALLGMRHRLAARSRMRAKQVYRAESLPR